ncbi:MAG: hypothetical protein LBU04_02485 [Christensenellaceae bacterium]|jgi:hypothetical protein|nr:hypothetical protein [Christensenellaceae bacterium]
MSVVVRVFLHFYASFFYFCSGSDSAADSSYTNRWQVFDLPDATVFYFAVVNPNTDFDSRLGLYTTSLDWDRNPDSDSDLHADPVAASGAGDELVP